jgi:hypothetical protein
VAPERPVPVILEPPEAYLRRLLPVVLEALAGRRPLAQLDRLLPSAVIGELVATPGMARRVRSVRVCRPVPEVAEACATVIAGSRAEAMAVRLELDGSGRWRCVDLVMLRPLGQA